MEEFHNTNNILADKIQNIAIQKTMPNIAQSQEAMVQNIAPHIQQNIEPKEQMHNINAPSDTNVQPPRSEQLESQITKEQNIQQEISQDLKSENTLQLIQDSSVENMQNYETRQENIVENFVPQVLEGSSSIEQLPRENLEFVLPKLGFLQKGNDSVEEIDENEIDRKINELLVKLKMFKIDGDIVRTFSGPIVTTFEFRPSPNVKVSRILNLQDDLAMALRAKTIRIQAPIPGKDVVGIEIPNSTIETIYLRDVLESEEFRESESPLTLALGKDIVGKPFITDLKKLPHLLIAGTTGSGKSVGINAMILSLLYRNTPDELKLIMIDPKMLEFSIYNDIPHLLTPVITQAKKAIMALDSSVKEMERRYTLMSEARTKNIEGYNQKAQVEGFEPFPYIVIIIDELADLMMTGGKDAEVSISRLAQMARASGIHLIVATQRPSVDVVTGLIKANLPSRISYKVGQRIDSKVILDTFGAESLLGRGDMLFTPPGGGLVRVHAPWSSEVEIEKIVEFIKSQRAPQYDESFMPSEDDNISVSLDGETDELYNEAKRIILTDRKTSISYLQRRLGIGYNKAANIIEQMEAKGFLGPRNSKGDRDIIGD
ncbi:DNA translocase FtsK [Helicobacter sp. WB40]|uniref:DNA translocase FtsK n=1 Tax=Helicobacter sp. WB40 TaxID=3004130 RepID=UPI0022EC1501|nr:DNA translocase FtsK [Helicobacter sp. WB40]MDA3967647.1 DNA translocase FtsK [Helicobacter sp. WB40]